MHDNMEKLFNLTPTRHHHALAGKNCIKVFFTGVEKFYLKMAFSNGAC